MEPIKIQKPYILLFSCLGGHDQDGKVAREKLIDNGYTLSGKPKDFVDHQDFLFTHDSYNNDVRLIVPKKPEFPGLLVLELLGDPNTKYVFVAGLCYRRNDTYYGDLVVPAKLLTCVGPFEITGNKTVLFGSSVYEINDRLNDTLAIGRSFPLELGKIQNRILYELYEQSPMPFKLIKDRCSKPRNDCNGLNLQVEDWKQSIESLEAMGMIEGGYTITPNGKSYIDQKFAYGFYVRGNDEITQRSYALAHYGQILSGDNDNDISNTPHVSSTVIAKETNGLYHFYECVKSVNDRNRSSVEVFCSLATMNDLDDNTDTDYCLRLSYSYILYMIKKF
jgi:hypothetical protein